jgi:hypothetical protein
MTPGTWLISAAVLLLWLQAHSCCCLEKLWMFGSSVARRANKSIRLIYFIREFPGLCLQKLINGFAVVGS